MPGRLEVHLVTPERELWSGEADMVVARGTEGEVGILANHAPLLIRLAIAPLRIRHDGQEERSVIDGGFLHVSTTEGVTRVDVLAQHAEMESEIDFEAAERARIDAERRIEARDNEMAEADLEKALARLSFRR